MNRLFPLAAVTLALTACSRPTEVAVQFHEALLRRDGTKAFSLLSKPTQEQLSKLARDAHDLSGGAVPDDPTLMIVQGDPSLYPAPAAKQSVARATMLSSEGPRAKVKVRLGEADHEMDLVKEGGRWRIDLPLGRP